jgi:hypothetical protein
MGGGAGPVGEAGSMLLLCAVMQVLLLLQFRHVTEIRARQIIKDSKPDVFIEDATSRNVPS